MTGSKTPAPMGSTSVCGRREHGNIEWPQNSTTVTVYPRDMDHRPSAGKPGPASDPDPVRDAEQPGDPPPRAGFLPRLDYYLKLAEGPGLPDEVTADMGEASGRGSGVTAQQDTAMVDPALANLTGHETSSIRSPRTGQLPNNRRGNHGIPGDVPGNLPASDSPYMFLNMCQPLSAQWNYYPGTGASQGPHRRGPLGGPGLPTLESHLIDCFFQWDNFFVDSFSQDLYLREKARYEEGRGDVLLYSPALGYAV